MEADLVYLMGFFKEKYKYISIPSDALKKIRHYTNNTIVMS